MRPLSILFAAALLAACTDSSSHDPQAGYASTEKTQDPSAAPQGAGTVIDKGLGLRVEIQEEGQGIAIQPGSHFDFHFTFYLAKDMKKVQSSYDLGRVQHQELGVDPALPGFQEGVVGLKEGTKARLYIPAHKGYQEAGFEDVVPPYADLIMDVHIVKVYAEGENH